MTEKELKIKLSVDTTNVKSQVAGVKKTVNEAVAPNTKAIKQNQQINTGLESIKSTLSTIRGMNLFDMIFSHTGKVRESMATLRKNQVAFKSVFKGVGGWAKQEFRQVKEDAQDLIRVLGSLFIPHKLNIGGSAERNPSTFQEYGEKYNIFSEKTGAIYGQGRLKGAFKAWKKAIPDYFSSLKQSFSDFSKSFGSLFRVLKAQGASLAAALKAQLLPILGVIAAIGIALYKLTKNAIACAQAMKQIVAESRRAGMAVAEYQKWGYVLEKLGVEHDKLIDFVKGLSAEQAQAIQGNKDTIKTFEKLGISQKKLLKLNQQQLFIETIKGLSKLKDEVERTSYAYKIFGEEDAANLLPLLKLTNQELETLTNNFKNLGGQASKNFVQQSQELGSATQDLKIVWEGLKNTFAEALLPTITPVVEWLVQLIAYMRFFFRAIFNLEEGAAGGIDDMNAGMNGFTNSTAGAIKEVEKLKRTTAGFDELNILSFGSDNSASINGGSINAGGGAGSIFELPTVEDLGLEGVAKWYNENKTILEDLSATLSIVLGIVIAIAGFASGNIPMGIVGIGMAGLGISIGAGEGGTWERWGEEIKSWGDDIVEWWNNGLGNAEMWKQSWENFKEPFVTGWEAIEEWFAGVKAAFKQDWENITDWFKGIGSKISNWFKDIKKKITDGWQVIADWFDENIKPIFTKKYWIELWENIKQGSIDGWNKLCKWFDKNVLVIFTKKYWVDLWGNMKQGAKDGFNGLIGIVEDAVNFIVRKLNTLSWDVPDWVPLIGGQHWGFDLKPVKIPRLAEGGIAMKSTYANIGEAGREAILPLDRNTQWMDMLAERISSPSTIMLMLDEKELGRANIRSINNITAQTGKLQLQLR